MSNDTPDDAHQVVLNFDAPQTNIDAHNVILNFSENSEKETNKIDSYIQILFQASILGAYSSPNHLNTSTPALIFLFSRIYGHFDLNFILGVFAEFNAEYTMGSKTLLNFAARCSKAITLSNQFFIVQDQGLTISDVVNSCYEKSRPIVRAIKKLFLRKPHN